MRRTMDKQQILLVEDSLTQALKIITMLEDKHFITHKVNGKEAIVYLESLDSEDLPDILISDIAMPIMDGFELSGIVKEKYPNIIIIMITGLFEEDVMSKAFEAGAAECRVGIICFLFIYNY